jgi:hypothetical protein
VESEMELPLVALHQLFAPMLSLLDALPEPQQRALGVAFGLAAESARLPAGRAAVPAEPADFLGSRPRSAPGPARPAATAPPGSAAAARRTRASAPMLRPATGRRRRRPAAGVPRLLRIAGSAPPERPGNDRAPDPQSARRQSAMRRAAGQEGTRGPRVPARIAGAGRRMRVPSPTRPRPPLSHAGTLPSRARSAAGPSFPPRLRRAGRGRRYSRHARLRAARRASRTRRPAPFSVRGKSGMTHCRPAHRLYDRLRHPPHPPAPLHQSRQP